MVLLRLSGSVDLDYIRARIPIHDIAQKLDLRISGGMIHCWRPERHQHGDRTPSVGLDSRRNSVKCFVCDGLRLSTIDLVMSVLGFNVAQAVKWILARYEVPSLPKGKHIGHSARWSERFRVGTTDLLHETLIRSGIWASLSPSQRSIVPVLQVFADPESRIAKISYRGIMKYAGVHSQSTVSIAIKKFAFLGFLKVIRGSDGEGLRACNGYHLCVDDPAFVESAAQSYEHHREQVIQERELRESLRRERASRLLPVNPLSTHCSKDGINASLS